MNESLVVIAGLGQISAAGQGVACLKSALSGESAPRQMKRKILTARGEREILVYEAPEVSLGPDIPESVRRRMSRISKMYFTAALEAMQDAFDAGRPEPTRMGLVIGTAFGPLEIAQAFERRIVLEGPTGASPSLFASSIQNAVASHLSISLGIQGPVSTITSLEQTALGSLRQGYDWIAQGVVDHVLVVVGDELTQFHAYAAAESPMGTSTRLNVQSDECTAVMGEGMASVLLSRASLAAKNYCQVDEIAFCARLGARAGARVLSAAYGGQGQWSRYVDWAGGITPLAHAHLYGAMLTGAAFEVVIGALLVNQDHRPTICVQLTDRGEAQILTLSHP